MSYTAADYEQVHKAWAHTSKELPDDYEVAVVASALRIAARVSGPIEFTNICLKAMDDSLASGTPISTLIREALTHPKEGT